VPPVAWFLATADPVMAVVGGLVVGSAAAYLILVVAMATQDCPGYLQGAGRVFFAAEGEGGAEGYAGWGLAVMSALALAGILLRIWRSESPPRKALAVADLFAGGAAAAFALVVIVMAFGDLVDWLLRKRRG